MPDSQRRHLGNCTAASGQGCAAELRANWREVAACRDAKPGVFFPIGTAGPTRQQIDQDKRKGQNTLSSETGGAKGTRTPDPLLAK
jgi:hypothetical protein